MAVIQEGAGATSVNALLSHDRREAPTKGPKGPKGPKGLPKALSPRWETPCGAFLRARSRGLQGHRADPSSLRLRGAASR